MIVLICGATASGKTSIIKQLFQDLDLKPIYTSSVMEDICSGKKRLSKKYKNLDMKQKKDQDFLRQKDKSLDRKLDKYLLNLVETEDNLIFDSWTLPYLSKKGIKIWLQTSLKERAKRFSLRENVEYSKALKDVKEKDNFSKKQFKKLYNMDFGKDLSVFNKIVDTENKNVKEICEEIKDYLKDNNFI